MSSSPPPPRPSEGPFFSKFHVVLLPSFPWSILWQIFYRTENVVASSSSCSVRPYENLCQFFYFFSIFFSRIPMWELMSICTTSKTCQWKLLFEMLFRMKQFSPKMASNFVDATLQWVNF
jgi:hypothetical protein